MNLKETYNRIAEDWHRDHLKDDWWVSDAERFVSLLPSQALVLDVGCAGGTKSRWLKERDMRVIGVDISEKMIAGPYCSVTPTDGGPSVPKSPDCPAPIVSSKAHRFRGESC